MEFLALNSTVLTPRGFRPTVHGPREGQTVAPRALWGTDHLTALRDAPLVRVDPTGAHDGDDRLILRSVVALALAGVPVTGHGLPALVRERLDRELLAVLDAVTPGTVRDAGERELLSLALRRRAWQVAGYRPPSTEPPTVLVLLPEGELPETLRGDLAAQVHPGLPVRCRQVAEGEEAARVVREERVVYVTRMTSGLRYGPHHLADLVHALGHSGARVALSPRRFLPWRDGAWLEDWRVPCEAPADEGLPGGSLWYAVDGACAPVPDGEGYAVHGAGAVPSLGSAGDPVGAAGAAQDDRAEGSGQPEVGLTPLRLHPSAPRVLAWHGDLEVDRPRARPAESYFARLGSG